MQFLLECRKVFRSVTFWIYCAAMILVFATQYFGDAGSKYEKPPAGRDNYGYRIVEDRNLIMKNAVNSLAGEFLDNRYICYPFGYYKKVSLKEKERNRVENYLFELTGMGREELEKLTEDQELCIVCYNMDGTKGYLFNGLEAKPDITYERFAEMMNDTDDMLGGGSSYGAERIVSEFSRVPLTYEDALEEYNSFLKDDRVTDAHARLYCDYMGIELSFMPVFAAAALAAADRRRKAEEVIYSSGISSVKLVFTRYAALVAVMFIPVLITMAVAFVQVLILYRGYELNIPSMFILPAVWLIPEIMTATAVGMLLTELFSAGAAIAVQIVWEFTCLMTGDSKLYGDIGKFDLICRHNNWGEREIFMMQSGNFIFNRIFYTVISAAAVLLAAYVYTLKREGVFNGIRITGQGGIFRRKA